MKINKIVHFSDLHLKLYKDLEFYKELFYYALLEWKEIKPDRIVFTGDMVHYKNQMTPELVSSVSWVLTECAKIAKTIVLIGNHDFLETNLEREDALSPIINTLNNDNIHYIKEYGVYNDENIDWVAYSLFNGNVAPEIPQTNNYKIGLFHGVIQGLETDLGYKFTEGYDIGKFSGCDIVLCGDIHKRQELYLNETKKVRNVELADFEKKGWEKIKEDGDVIEIKRKVRIIQIGSFIQQNFGESIRNHGYGVYDVSKLEYTYHNIENYRPYLNFKITDFDECLSGNEKLINS